MKNKLLLTIIFLALNLPNTLAQTGWSSELIDISVPIPVEFKMTKNKIGDEDSQTIFENKKGDVIIINVFKNWKGPTVKQFVSIDPEKKN